MYEVNLINMKTGATFTKVFYDYNKMRVFVLKVRHGNKLKITSIVKW